MSDRFDPKKTCPDFDRTIHPCGCQTFGAWSKEIAWCPLHAAAPGTKRQRDELLKAAKAVLETYKDNPCWHDHHGLCQAHHMRTNNGVPECEVALLTAAVAKAEPRTTLNESDQKL